MIEVPAVSRDDAREVARTHTTLFQHPVEIVPCPSCGETLGYLCPTCNEPLCFLADAGGMCPDA